MRAEIKRRSVWRIMNVLRGTKGMETEVGFKSITDALFGSKLVKSFLPNWLVPEYFKTQGSATVAWRKWSAEVIGFMTNLYTTITDHQEMMNAEAKKRAALEAARLGGIGELARKREHLQKEKKALAQRLEALGIKIDPTLLKKDTKEKSGAELRHEWKTDQTKSQLAVLQAYGALQQCCVGFSGASFISGTHKFNLELQGFDIFEVAPELDLDDLVSRVSMVGSSNVSLSSGMMEPPL